MSWEYIAGFFDGEGNVSYFGEKAFSTINISQSRDRGFRVLSLIKEFLETQGIKAQVYSYDAIKFYGQRGVDGNYASVHRLHVIGREAVVSFMEGVLPFLHVKQIEVQDCLRYQKIYPSLNRDRYWQLERVANMTRGRIEAARLRRESSITEITQ